MIYMPLTQVKTWGNNEILNVSENEWENKMEGQKNSYFHLLKQVMINKEYWGKYALHFKDFFYLKID